ncbi:MAG: hypothetical protein M3Z74_08655, partial [Pseudomonadota bacterium]|nr:hypothetical protein [Pseudomonadota bacterium]
MRRQRHLMGRRLPAIMVFLLTIIFIIAVLLAALAGYAIGLRGRAGHVLPEDPLASAPAPALAAPGAPMPAAVTASASADQSTEME